MFDGYSIFSLFKGHPEFIQQVLKQLQEMDVSKAEEPFILRCLKYILTLPYPELEHEADK